jgi:signal transduction histidine kinase/ligand-binding sensor domain-containing protein
VSVDIVEHLPYLPSQQALFSVVRGPFHRPWIKPTSQQRGCLEYRAVRGLFLMKVTHGRIQQCYYIVHPVTRPALTELLTGLRFADLSFHTAASDRGTVPAPERDVDRELQWTKSPSIEGLPRSTRCRHILFGMRTLHAQTSAVNEGHLVRRQKCWLAIVALLWCGGAAALSPDLTLKELHHTAWGPSQGAPLGGAVALAQTNDGYLWIAGPSGLFRFDGITFERVELPHDPKLSSLSLISAFAPRDGGLWVGFTFGGVALLKEEHWQVFSAADGVPTGSAAQFAETPDGTLWVATDDGLARFDAGRWKAVGSQMGLPASDNPVLFVDSQGTMWAGGEKSLFFLRAGEHKFRNQPIAASTPWAASSMAESSSGTVWLDAGYDLVPVAQNPPPRTARASSRGELVFDHDGTLWASADVLRRVAHPEHPIMGVALHLEDNADPYTDADGLTSRTVFALLADREGNVWVGTTQGLDRFSEPSLKAPLQSAENLQFIPRMIVAGVAPADDAGGVWVTNGVDAVVRYQDGRMSPPIIKQKVEVLLRVADGTVWFGGRKALWRERQGQLDSVAPPGPDENTQALAQDKYGGLWASVLGSGVFRLKDGVWTPYGGIAALPRGTAITIVSDRRDRLWFSYPGGGVAVLDGERVRSYGLADGLQIGNVMANHPGRIGHWLGGELGLARFDGERFYSIQSAPDLPVDGITGIVETPDGDLWLNGRAGIVHIAATELERSRLDPAYRVRGETLGAFDGVVGSSATVRPLPTAIEATDGILWFATTSGIYGLDPVRRVRNRTPPRVLIRALTVAGHNIDSIPGLTLPAYTTAVRFDYIGLSLTAAEKVRYRYRLEGVDADWHELTAARQAFYTNLRPSHYTFRVIAANNDGVWNESGASLAFVIPPAFVQTGWFIALCVAGAAAAVWALVRLRVRRVHRRLEERMEVRLNERTRIARELHDSLLQGFQGLMFRLQAVRQLLPERPGDAAKSLDSAMQVGDQAIGEGRDAVQDLRSSSFDDRDLATSLSALGTELGTGSDPSSKPEYRVIVEGRPRNLTAVVRDEAYRIAREAVSNAYQHATARHIETEVTFGDADLAIRVRDDGIGMDAQILARGQRPGHWGLPGMRERSESFGGHLHVWSEGHAGTEIELRIPAHIAYSELRRPTFAGLKNLLRSRSSR